MVRLLKNLYLRKLPRVLQPLLLMGYLTEAACFDLSPSEELDRLVKLAEAQVLAGAREEARRTLSQIQKLAPEEDDVGRIQKLMASHAGA